MLICNYCKRNFKEDYKNCPGCGSDSFKKVEDKLEYVIETPPTGGYKLPNMGEFKVSDKDKNTVVNVFVIMIVMAMFCTYIFFSFFFKERMLQPPYIFVYIGINLIFVGLVLLLHLGKNKIKLDNKLTKRERLQQRGVLYKNLPYTVETYTREDSDGHKFTYYRIVITYKLKDGVERTFKGKSSTSPKSYMSNNGTADLIVDPEDYNNYFVDLEIY